MTVDAKKSMSLSRTTTLALTDNYRRGSRGRQSPGLKVSFRGLKPPRSL